MLNIRWKWLSVVLTVMLMCVALPAYASLALRSVLALMLVLYLPGHMISRLVRPQSVASLDGILFAFGLSLAAVIAGGFLLHMMGFMTPVGWAIYLISVTALAWAAEKKSGEQPQRTIHRPALSRISAVDGVMLGCAAMLAVGAIMIDRHEAAAHSEFKYTEFWMVAKDADSPNALTVGVRNGEGKPATYEVEFMNGGQMAGRLPAFRLQPGEAWTSELNVGFPADRIERVEAWLFKDRDHSTVYRRVWADIGRASPGEL